MHAIDERVLISIETHVAHLQLTRPAKMNAVDLRSFEAIADAATWLAARTDVRAVVLSGEGRGFCSGMDLDAFGWLLAPDAGTRLRDRRFGDANVFQWCALAWRKFPVPVIAALHGPVFGAGFQIALGADMRFCAADARLSLRELHWGTVPDMAATILLPELVGADVFRDLMFTARIITGEEAHRLGVVTRLCGDPVAEALAAARDLASLSPSAIRAAKRMANAAASRGVGEALAAEVEEQLAIINMPDHRETMAARREGRPALYSPA